jgi:hypothetical protein
MKTLSRDTDAATEQVWVELIRRQPVWKKIQQIGRLHDMARALARAGFRRRLPGDEATVEAALDEHWLGPDLARRVANARRGGA